MLRRKRPRRRPDAEHHARARQPLPLPREVVDIEALGRVMVEFERIIPDEERTRSSLGHGIGRHECPRLVLRCGIVRTSQDDLEEGVRGCGLVREQNACISDLLRRDAADEQYTPHIAIRGNAHIRQDEQIIRVPRVRDRGHPRHIQIPRLQPSVQLCGRRTQDIQPLRSPVRKRIRQRQYIQKSNMTQTRHHAHPPLFLSSYYNPSAQKNTVSFEPCSA